MIENVKLEVYEADTDELEWFNEHVKVTVEGEVLCYASVRRSQGTKISIDCYSPATNVWWLEESMTLAEAREAAEDAMRREFNAGGGFVLRWRS